MRFRRSFLSSLLSSLIGFCFVLGLHACEAPSAISADPSMTAVEPSITAVSPPKPVVLPPETEAIVNSVPGGLVDPPRGDVRIVVISDLNSAYGSTDYDPEVDQGVALIPFWQPDMVVCGGDMVAGQDPSLTDEQIRAMWAAFDEHVTAPLRQFGIPFGFTIGNHDASAALDSSGGFIFENERNLAIDYWNDPAHDPGIEFVDRDEFPFYYTFKHDDVFFLTWDGSSSSIPPEKLDWIEQTLSSPEAQSAKLRILIGHLPLYAVAIGRDAPAEVMDNADQLRDILERHNVHTYISGHHHAYYPAHKGNLQLLHTGNLGSGPRSLIDGTPPRKSITVLDVDFESPDLTTYTTYDMATLQPIANEELPRFLTGHNGMVLRRDVDELNAAEQGECESVLGADRCAA